MDSSVVFNPQQSTSSAIFGIPQNSSNIHPYYGATMRGGDLSPIGNGIIHLYMRYILYVASRTTNV